MRHYLFISAAHKIIIVHRAALGTGGDAHERIAAERACITAAEAIVTELDRGGKDEISMQSLWTIPYHGLAAAVVLALSITRTKDTKTVGERRQGVDKARLALERLSPTSRIARRGLQVGWQMLTSNGHCLRQADWIGHRRSHARDRRGSNRSSGC
jgi:hypothetical protein